jgi:acyl-CoA synthetase (AMP-forming)/AMP-acid ligase II
MNLYGPAEGTVACTQFFVTSDVLSQDIVPIGKPLEGAHIRLRTEPLTEIPPIQERGLIELRGPSVSLGYIRRADDEVFEIDPFDPGGTNDEALFTTSDLVEKDCHDDFHFLGRVEGLLKINGVRTSAQEIQLAVLRSGAEECVVAPPEGPGRRAIGYVRLQPGVDITTVESRLREYLPHAVLPVLRVVGIIPKSVNGKLDIRELTERIPCEVSSSSAHDEALPGDEKLLGLIAKLFPAQIVSYGRDLFDLGANSLDIVLLIELVCDRYGVLLDPEDVLMNTGIADLAALINERAQAQVTAI